MRRADAPLCKPLERLFDDAVFERMECNDRQSASRPERSYGCSQRALQNGQLFVYLNADRLKDAFRRMSSFCACLLRNGAIDHRNKLSRRLDRMGLALLFDECGNAFRPPFFAVVVKDLRQFGRRVFVDNAPGTAPRTPIHTHVKGASCI